MHQLAPLYTLVYQKQGIAYFGKNRHGFGSNFRLERLSRALEMQMATIHRRWGGGIAGISRVVGANKITVSREQARPVTARRRGKPQAIAGDLSLMTPAAMNPPHHD